jgi:hypothetical protein
MIDRNPLAKLVATGQFRGASYRDPNQLNREDMSRIAEVQHAWPLLMWDYHVRNR